MKARLVANLKRRNENAVPNNTTPYLERKSTNGSIISPGMPKSNKFAGNMSTHLSQFPSPAPHQ